MTDERRALERKGRRVAGMFLLMIGAGIVLESPRLWAGLGLMLAGLGLYGHSFIAKGGGDVIAGEGREES